MSAELWRNEDVLCEYACVRVKDPRDPEDMGSVFPDTECETHWAEGAEEMRLWYHQERVARWRRWRMLRRAWPLDDS